MQSIGVPSSITTLSSRYVTLNSLQTSIGRYCPSRTVPESKSYSRPPEPSFTMSMVTSLSTLQQTAVRSLSQYLQYCSRRYM